MRLCAVYSGIAADLSGLLSTQYGAVAGKFARSTKAQGKL